MRHLSYALGFCLLVFCIPKLSGHEDKPKVPREKLDPQKVKALMHRKLENAQKILEALTLNDLNKASKSAGELIQVSKEIEWVVFKTRDYQLYSDDFRRAAESLVQQAKDKNLEGAKLSYLSMTMTCFHCHAYVRDVGMVRLDSMDASR